MKVLMLTLAFVLPAHAAATLVVRRAMEVRVAADAHRARLIVPQPVVVEPGIGRVRAFASDAQREPLEVDVPIEGHVATLGTVHLRAGDAVVPALPWFEVAAVVAEVGVVAFAKEERATPLRAVLEDTCTDAALHGTGLLRVIVAFVDGIGARYAGEPGEAEQHQKGD